MRFSSLVLCLSFCTITSGMCADEPTLPPSPSPAKEGSPVQFNIVPKARALDFLQAFTVLRQEKIACKVGFFLKDGSMISNIIDINLMDEGSLFIIRYNSGQGIKFRVLGLEEILRLEPL